MTIKELNQRLFWFLAGEAAMAVFATAIVMWLL
jgi:hypothetical protein